jgi:nitrite reductase (NADH) small subunit
VSEAAPAPAGRRQVVCRVDELPPGQRKIVMIDRREIGVFNVGGRYYALRNACPHQGGPVCEGELCGLAVADKPYEFEIVRQGEILRCPWHRWEVDVTTGKVLVHPTFRIKSYPVDVEKLSVETFPVGAEDGAVVLYA